MKIRHLRWYIAALLFASTVINYIDRQTLSVVAPVLTKELRLSDVEYANVLQAFLLPYTLMYLVSGVLVDRWGTRISLSVFMAWWSASNALHMAARSALQLSVFRFLLGAGEPGNYMAAGKAISEWYPPQERGFVNGLVNAGSSIGAVVAAPLVVWITIRFGWRAAFLATGCMGMLWLGPWLFFYRLPERSPRITAAELQHIRGTQAGGGAAGASRCSWLGLLRYRETWGLLLARFLSDPVWWFYLFWMPKYLVESRGFTLAEMGMLVWLPFLAADLGSVAGGLASGLLIKKNWAVLRARSAVMLPSAMLMPLSLVIAFTSSSPLALLLICVVTFCHMAWKTNLMTVNNDIYPTAVLGSLSGVVSLGSGLGGAVFTYLTGRIVGSVSYAAVFVIMGFLHPTAYLIYALLVRKTPAIESRDVHAKQIETEPA